MDFPWKSCVFESKRDDSPAFATFSENRLHNGTSVERIRAIGEGIAASGATGSSIRWLDTGQGIIA